MDSDQEKNRGFVVSHHHQSKTTPPPEPPSAFPPQFPPPPSVPPYYGTFQGIPTYPPSTGIPQPGAASSYYNTTHAYQSVPVPGYAVDEERPIMRDDRLPCCGCPGYSSRNPWSVKRRQRLPNKDVQDH
ncbi:hypothetical protein V2J09_005698 [Rumex salicifolius]